MQYCISCLQFLKTKSKIKKTIIYYFERAITNVVFGNRFSKQAYHTRFILFILFLKRKNENESQTKRDLIFFFSFSRLFLFIIITILNNNQLLPNTSLVNLFNKLIFFILLGFEIKFPILFFTLTNLKKKSCSF